MSAVVTVTSPYTKAPTNVGYGKMAAPSASAAIPKYRSFGLKISILNKRKWGGAIALTWYFLVSRIFIHVIYTCRKCFPFHKWTLLRRSDGLKLPTNININSPTSCQSRCQCPQSFTLWTDIEGHDIKTYAGFEGGLSIFGLKMASHGTRVLRLKGQFGLRKQLTYRTEPPYKTRAS